MRQFKRSERISSQMLRDVQALLEHECSTHLKVLVTFTDVEISEDLRYATIFYSVLGDDQAKENVAIYLSGKQKKVKGQLGNLLRIKHTPEIRFRFDPSVERGVRIEQILRELAKKDDRPGKESL